MPSNMISPNAESVPSSRCPLAEYEKILERNPILAPTGCTDKFCQAGRLVHTDEPKIGDNSPLEIVQNEASAFLWQLWQDGIYTEDHYTERRAQVMADIDRSAKDKIVWNQGVKRVGKTSTWTQTFEELQYGLRLAWRNSRKCIMRSRYQELELCDLRHVQTSVGMATALLEEITKSFNDGQIRPTVFVFPPKSVDGDGPMFWNKQILNFAAVDLTTGTQYELDDGSILGDPSNVQLTKDIIDLGWTPPSPRTRWDLLPVVAMAEDDAPAMVELPDKLRRLIDIEHPDYPGFGKLNLKWYQFPALSRLGFDIGGVQYMDAEIGVRNLADTFRYDSLPDVAKAIGFDIDSYRQKQEYSEVRAMEDLPDYEQLRWLSRAQAELNYAVRWSFLKKGVTCVGTLAASSDWCQYDDDHAAKNGYRLNSDPYWISPPQGSIVPVWHRGGAPNYQPKPMICRNRYDPVKCWQRRKSATDAEPVRLVIRENRWATEILSAFPISWSERHVNPANERLPEAMTNTVHICYCSKGTTARVLADKLHRSVKKKCAKTSHVSFTSLNALDLHQVGPSDVILVVAATTGSGAFPSNGDEFARSMDQMLHTMAADFSGLRVSIFGVGDSAYPRFNAAAIGVYNFFRQFGILPIAGGLIKADVASEALPLRLFNRWLDAVESSLTGGVGELRENPEEDFMAHAVMLRQFNAATLISKSSPTTAENEGLIVVALDGIEYAEMQHLRLLPTNSSSQVARALAALGIEDAQESVPFCDEKLQQCSYQDLFAGFRPIDGDIIRSTTSLAETHRVLDISCLVPSNKEKKRVQDFLWLKRDEIRAKLVEEEGYVYVCGSASMTEGVRAKLREIVGEDPKERLGDRYVEEVF
ncbi:nitric-oxide synthase [Aspergillus ibericus CBS 121593]|uniref:nitric-oxide synthase (NADPH) n=1 Tax=Aspergillus ibericus CBS 121593 TaxID=1448316 RepID=A0A395GRK5_9EURO|nr:nitric-oxide synthase [Aspergillus ibericus CBS 121593]RAK98175.1 nitric-oxide synthase [Aspergillus ibericus CBS 121593]